MLKHLSAEDRTSLLENAKEQEKALLEVIALIKNGRRYEREVLIFCLMLSHFDRRVLLKKEYDSQRTREILKDDQGVEKYIPMELSLGLCFEMLASSVSLIDLPQLYADRVREHITQILRELRSPQPIIDKVEIRARAIFEYVHKGIATL